MDSVLPDFISLLQLPETYPHPVENVELLQTHISYVTLAGDYAYKWKKPVDFGFLNFSTLEKRKYYCEQELSLNRRLCPELYLGIVAICDVDGTLQLCNEDAIIGTLVEYGIKMVRMDQKNLMGALLENDKVTTNDLDNIVDTLVPFYQSAENSEELNAFGTAEGFGVNVIENFDQTEGFIGGEALSRATFDTIKSFSMNFLAKTELFNSRIASGKIRDCHGDMYSANICLGDTVQIFDCIEFNERFRYSDVAADIAFLAMDLDFHGREDLSRYFVDRFVEISGDLQLVDVLNFYCSYRAYVRGKIGLFTASDPSVPKVVAEKCMADAKKYFDLAVGYCVL